MTAAAAPAIELRSVDIARLTQLARRRKLELASEGMVEGSLQVPPDGHPILFLANHPTTGGYPVIAVVAGADLPLAAQARPGRARQIHINPCGPASTAALINPTQRPPRPATPRGHGRQ